VQHGSGEDLLACRYRLNYAQPEPFLAVSDCETGRDQVAEWLFWVSTLQRLGFEAPGLFIRPAWRLPRPLAGRVFRFLFQQDGLRSGGIEVRSPGGFRTQGCEGFPHFQRIHRAYYR
jgi:hypothetical protein